MACMGIRVLTAAGLSLVVFYAPTVFSLVEINRYQDDPDISSPTPDIIRRHNYPAESHTVETKDGYLLTLHRIPATNISRGVVYLQHGLLGSSADWVLIGPDSGLGYLLADEGFDVWLGNVRGNTYSRQHITYTSDDLRFWDFSWSEMATYDIPASIDYILEKTSQDKLYYIGHSMGTTMFFALASTMPEYNNKIQEMFALAPVAYVANMKSPLKYIAPFAKDLEFWIKYLGHGAFLPQNKIIELFSRYACNEEHWEEEICRSLIFLLCGFDKTQFNMTLLPNVLSHQPAGTSTRTVMHYAQEINSGKFEYYDFGCEENEKRYNSSKPPEYNVSSIGIPIKFFYAENDWLAAPLDVQHLYQKLQCSKQKYLVDSPEFNHNDFIWAKDVKKLVYDLLIQDLKKSTRGQTILENLLFSN